MKNADTRPKNDAGMAASAPNMIEATMRERPGWDRSTAATTALVALATLYGVYFARELLLPITAAYFLKLVLTPLVRWLRRRGVPEWLGAALVLGATVAAAGLSAYQLIEPANEWFARAPKILRQASAELRVWKKPVENLTRAAHQVEAMTEVSPGNGTPPVEVRGPSLASLLFESTSNFVATALATLVLLYLLLASGDLFLRKAITILPRLEDKVAAVDLSRELEQNISSYLLTVSLINLGLGVVVGVCMHWLEMPNPYLWGMMVAILNFVPYLGPLASIFILTLAAYVTFDDLGRALLVGGVYFGVNALESYFVTPAILGRRMSMNPVAIFIAMMFFGWAWGIYGLLLAVPILAMIKQLCEHVEPLNAVSELISA
jgi:predicted PurR-regulated permease PerM